MSAPWRAKGHTLQGNNQAGFTLLELAAVMVVSLIFSGLIMVFLFNYWRAGATLTTSSINFVSRLTAGDRLREAINTSSGLIIQNSLVDDHAGAPDPAYPSGQYWDPLHAVPGTISIGASGTFTPVLYFRAPSIDTSSNIIMNGAQPYEDEFVLYMDGSTKALRMRVLANPSAPSNRLKTTCPPASVSATCPLDRLIVENVSTVALRYFSRSGNLMNHHDTVDPDTGEYIGPDLPAVEVVEMTLGVFVKSQLKGGADTTSQTIIRVALRNK